MTAHVEAARGFMQRIVDVMPPIKYYRLNSKLFNISGGKRQLFLITLFCAALAGTAHALPSYTEVRQAYRTSDTLLLARDGSPLQRLRTDATARRGDWVTLTDVSPALRHALLLSEDKRFYEHSGVDWPGVAAAAWGNLWATRTRGASTVTMQLAGLLDDDWRAARGGRSVPQKLGQAVAAQVLERRWRKDEILEAYLNLVPFRGELVGVDALSRHLFGKAPHGLDAREAAVAAALLRAPNASSAVVAQRACGIWQPSAVAPAPARGKSATTPITAPITAPTTATNNATTATTTTAPQPDCAALTLFTQGVLSRPLAAPPDADLNLAPHALRAVMAQLKQATPRPRADAPRSLPSTLDAPLQRFAVDTLRQQLRELRGRNVSDGAVVVLDNASGEVLAWVGSSGPLSAAAQVDGVTAMRQAGSTLKPFLYAQAIAQRKLTAASLLDDSPTHIPTAGGLYIPQNYDHQFKGWVSVRTALASSLNVPAVRTLVLVGPSEFAQQLRALGLPLAKRGEHYGYSLALGSAEVSLLNLTNAYRTLANGGLAGPTRLVPSPLPNLTQPPSKTPSPSPNTVTKPTSVTPTPSTPASRTFAAAPSPALDPRAAFIVGDILADPNARARTFGSDSLLATRHWAAVKTGTSKDMRDNWAVGYTRHHTIGVWVGNANGEPMHSVSGTTGAAPIWAALVQNLSAGDGSSPSRLASAPIPPPGLEHTPVAFDQQREASRPEWFIAGTAQPLMTTDSMASVADPAAASRTHPSSRSPSARILSPTNGALLALDPDIPPRHQRVQLRARAPGTPPSQLRWLVDGKPLASGPNAAWLPWPGQHRIRLTTATGVVLDEVAVEVRGAGLKR